MNQDEVLTSVPYFRAPMEIPTNWCMTCQLTLRSEAEYSAHVGVFPSHRVKQITSLVCPKCGTEVQLEGGKYARHWLEYFGTMRPCKGSGGQA